MRWDLLFDDLESQLDQEQRDEERALALEEERLRLARLTLRDRLTALSRADDRGPIAVRIELHGGAELELRPLAFGRDQFGATSRGQGRNGAGGVGTSTPRMDAPPSRRLMGRRAACTRGARSPCGRRGS